MTHKKRHLIYKIYHTSFMILILLLFTGFLIYTGDNLEPKKITLSSLSYHPHWAEDIASQEAENVNKQMALEECTFKFRALLLKKDIAQWSACMELKGFEYSKEDLKKAIDGTFFKKFKKKQSWFVRLFL